MIESSVFKEYIKILILDLAQNPRLLIIFFLVLLGLLGVTFVLFSETERI